MLRQGDVIFVPPIGQTLGVAGFVHRPGIYETLEALPVAEVIGLAGGTHAVHLYAACPDRTHDRWTRSRHDRRLAR